MPNVLYSWFSHSVILANNLYDQLKVCSALARYRGSEVLTCPKMGAYKYIGELYKKKQSDVLRFLLRVRYAMFHLLIESQSSYPMADAGSIVS